LPRLTSHKCPIATTKLKLTQGLGPVPPRALCAVGGATDLAKYVPYTGIDAITLCNVTEAANGESQALNTTDNPPLIKVASDRWPLWAFTDASRYRLPCAWETSSDPSIAPMTGDTYTARVEACVESDDFEMDLLCKRYPELNSVIKPIGMLQQFGDEKSMRSGLITGSYGKNISGGVLRRNAGCVSGNDADQSDGDDPAALDGLDLDTGVFTGNPDIIKILDSMRINKYDYGTAQDYPGLPKDYMGTCEIAGISAPANGQCTNWGIPAWLRGTPTSVGTWGGGLQSVVEPHTGD
jgi:type IV pilus assembly protein PilY1